MANAWVMRPLPMPAITATSSAAGHDPMFLANDFAGIVWKSAAGLSSVALTVDMGDAVALDAALFFGCTAAAAGWKLTVESADNSAFTVNASVLANAVPFLAGAALPTHGRGVGYWEGEGALVARRWWRFTVSSLSNAPVTIARLAVGQRLQLERNFAFGGGWGVRDLGTVDFSRQGALLRTRGAKLRTVGLTFPAVGKDEVEEKVQPLVELVAGQEPIILVTDPAPHAQRQRRCWFGHLFGELGTVWRTSAGWEWRANLIDLVPVTRSS